MAISQGDLNLAEELLNAQSDHDAEWNFLKGAVCYRRGWLDEARQYYQTAVQMAPDNAEYQRALDMAGGPGRLPSQWIQHHDHHLLRQRGLPAPVRRNAVLQRAGRAGVLLLNETIQGRTSLSITIKEMIQWSKSMTGYGRAREMRNGRDITVEVRSVNNRYLDCTVKMPRAYIFAEDRMKARVQQAISRGKVDVFVTIDASAADEAVVAVNEPLARGYYEALTRLKTMFALPGEVTPEVLAKFPDVLAVTKAEGGCGRPSPPTSAPCWTMRWQRIMICAPWRVRSWRRTWRAASPPSKRWWAGWRERSPQTVAAYRQRLEAKMQEVLQSTTIDESRILTEAAIFADKIAVDEETVRLCSHIAQLRAMLASDEPVGRKLDFLIQEVNRECNTIGSKCSDLTIAQDVVNMKAEVEKIREQVQNME